MAKGKDKKQELIQKAVQLFLKHGYEKTSMRDLAKAVGIQAPGLYYYFKSKREILQEINQQSWQHFSEFIYSEMKKVEDPEERIRIYIRSMIKYQFSLGHITFIVDDSLSSKYIKERQSRDREVFDFIRETMHQIAVKNGITQPIDATLATFSLFGMVTRVYRWYKPKGRLTLDEIAEHVTRLFFYGYVGDVKKKAVRRKRQPSSRSDADRAHMNDFPSRSTLTTALKS